MKNVFFVVFLMPASQCVKAQTQQDALAIRQAALDDLESQQSPSPAQMERALPQEW